MCSTPTNSGKQMDNEKLLPRHPMGKTLLFDQSQPFDINPGGPFQEPGDGPHSTMALALEASQSFRVHSL